jgi:hypothetical protein
MKTLSALVLAALLSSCTGESYVGPLNHNPEVPNAPRVSSIGGTVYDFSSGLAIEGAQVTAASAATQSQADGRYELTGITVQVIVLEATKSGYQARAVQLPINPGHNDVQLWMQKLPD